MNNLVLEAQAMENELIKWRRHLHQNAEIGMDVSATAAFVKDQLEEMGCVANYIGVTGVTAVVGDEKKGKCFLLRADMDALPIVEETDLEFKSRNGNMHACGHDLHTVMLLGAAKLLRAYENEIDGCVKLMFQPAEETLEGANILVNEGILEKPKVDAAAMFHVMLGTPMPTGFVVVPNGGVFSSACDWFEILIEGKGGHGASPEKTIDPLNVVAHIHIALQSISSREVSSDDNAVVTIGVMEGGTVSNVIPDSAMLKGTVRTFNEETRKFIVGRIKEIADNTAKTFRAKAITNFTIECPSVNSDSKVANDVFNSLNDVFGPLVSDSDSIKMPRMSGSEDFAFISQKVPSVMMFISAGSVDEGYTYSLHNPSTVFNEKVLCQGATAYAISAMGWLAKNK